MNPPISFTKKGWHISRYQETKIPPDLSMNACFIRSSPLDKMLFPESVKHSIQHLGLAFPDFRIEVREIRRIIWRSFEIEGRPLKPDENRMFWIKLTLRKIYVKIYGIESDEVLNCIY
jgi:hypothetical protein